MKRVILGSFLLAFFMLCGCQPTPEEPIVVQKDTDAMLEQAIKETAEADEQAEETETIADRLGIPERVQLSAESPQGHLHLNVDAKTLYPDVEKMPVYRTEIKAFSQEQVDRMIEVLFGGAPAVTMAEEEYGVLTKEQISDLILYYQSIIAEERWEEHGATKESYENRIAEMQKKMTDAPATLADLKTQPSDGKLIADGDKQTLRVFADIGDLYFADLMVCNDVSEKTVTCNFSRGSGNGEAAENPYSEEEAAKIADQLLKDLGVEDMVIIRSNFQKNSQEYSFTYTRMLDGSLVYNIEGESDRDEYGIPWEHEKIMVRIGADGVSSFEWISPSELGECITDDAQMLPFSEIEKRIGELFFQSYSETAIFGDKGGEPVDIDYNVCNIQLCHMRVDEQDTGAGLLIPVWMICGSDDGKPDIRHYMNIAACSDHMLTINAIDGGRY